MSTRIVAYIGHAYESYESPRYRWELIGDDADTLTGQEALKDALRKNLLKPTCVGVLLRIPAFGEAPNEFPDLNVESLLKKVDGKEIDRVMKEEKLVLARKVAKIAASIPAGNPLKDELLLQVKKACPGHTGEPMSVPPGLSVSASPEVRCGTCDAFCPQRKICKSYGDFPVDANLVCSTWHQIPAEYNVADFDHHDPYEDLIRGMPESEAREVLLASLKGRVTRSG